MLNRKVPRQFVYDSELILVEKKDNVAIVTMNNPPMNTNTLESMSVLLEYFRLFQYDPDVRAVILTGAGTRAFNVGSDVSGMPAMTGHFRDIKFNLEGDLMATVDELPKPTICAIEGYCLGGGLELASCCDIRIASSKAKFGLPELNLGLVPGSGGLFRVPKLIGPSRTLELIYTARHIDAEEALQIGLINHLCEPGTAKDTAFKLAQKIIQASPKTLRVAKAFVKENAFKPNSDCFRKNLDYIDDIFEDYNAMEGIAAFMEKRPHTFLYHEE